MQRQPATNRSTSDSSFPDAAHRPGVSVVIATYNRSKVLKMAIQSVLQGTYQDFEILVIGDACTDNTEEVVRSFEDPRIRFRNLEINVGEQSGPNNVGIEEARGRYVAFLNHDDVWSRDHLNRCLDVATSTGAGIVHGLAMALDPDGEARILGAHPPSGFKPHIFVPASSWLVESKVFNRVGGWRHYTECHAVPSQDWLFRAWKNGERIAQTGSITVVVIQSGLRLNSYREDHDDLQRAFLTKSESESEFLFTYLEKQAIRDASRPYDLALNVAVADLLSSAWHFMRALVFSILLLLGQSPQAFTTALRFGRKGNFIRALRQTRGLTVNQKV